MIACCRQADESPEQFWQYVEGWSNPEGSIHRQGNGTNACWSAILTTASVGISTGLASLLPTVLASRKYSPRLEVYATLAADAGAPKQVGITR